MQKKVREAMGGEVLELLNDRAERMAREAKEQGVKQGVKQGASVLAELLRARGVEDSLIEEAMADFRERQEREAAAEDPGEGSLEATGSVEEE